MQKNNFNKFEVKSAAFCGGNCNVLSLQFCVPENLKQYPQFHMLDAIFLSSLNFLWLSVLELEASACYIQCVMGQLHNHNILQVWSLCIKLLFGAQFFRLI